MRRYIVSGKTPNGITYEYWLDILYLDTAMELCVKYMERGCEETHIRAIWDDHFHISLLN